MHCKICFTDTLLQEEGPHTTKTGFDIDTQKQESNFDFLNNETSIDRAVENKTDVDSHNSVGNSFQNPNENEFIDELDEAAIIKNHLDPVPFPEPLFDPTPSYRYILWNQTDCPIKVFKETPV